MSARIDPDVERTLRDAATTCGGDVVVPAVHLGELLDELADARRKLGAFEQAVDGLGGGR